MVIDAATGWYVTPTSVKAVVLDGTGRVLLGLNPRGERELPGGWPHPDDTTLEDTVRREVAEECGLEITVEGVVTAVLHRGTGGLPPVVLVVVRATAPDGATPTTSEERSRTGFFALDDLPEPLPETYRTVIDRAAGPLRLS